MSEIIICELLWRYSCGSDATTVRAREGCLLERAIEHPKRLQNPLLYETAIGLSGKVLNDQSYDHISMIIVGGASLSIRSRRSSLQMHEYSQNIRTCMVRACASTHMSARRLHRGDID